ncbi:dephospho-CoA kinase [Paucibacter sp. B2R-40]|uniref:dephospho-CoA kinase n=1 Tax=Paucibacter sp. B2R-40 TaxID=2893554 RepID=UPI0021E4E599|nr:dephospho-CoA kinase [Paucibacter sp. B2R-40]MCV2356215.1 dephospho-CoA kinase [Paucibacter sp. B2R-40]
MKIGLTGGIGSGKSTVAGFWQAAGATLIDTDAIARQLSAPGGAAMPAIAAEFGASMLSPDGALDRAAMRQLAFADTSAKRRLEAILHPLIGAEARQQADAATAAGVQLIVYDVPLLVESGHWRARVERLLVVDCSEQTQLARVSTRPGWSVAAAAAVLAAQASRAQRRACADAVIYNEGLSLAALNAQVLTLAADWRGPNKLGPSPSTL